MSASFCVVFSPFFLHFELDTKRVKRREENKKRRRTTTNALKRERFQEEEKRASSSIFHNANQKRFAI
jgi:hypothetical protein